MVPQCHYLILKITRPDGTVVNYDDRGIIKKLEYFEDFLQVTKLSRNGQSSQFPIGSIIEGITQS